MRHVLTIISGVVVLGVAVAATTYFDDNHDDTQMTVDRGYECFNLEIAQAQLAQARADRNWVEIIKSRASVRNREKLCPVSDVLILEG